MQLVQTISPLEIAGGSAVALGFFDGVHLGHRAVLGAAAQYARQNGLTPAAFTFSLPVGSNLKGGRILSATQKWTRIEQQGIAACLEPEFATFKDFTPEEFVDKILLKCLQAKAVFCGDNFTFGAHAAGNVALLQSLCAARGIETHVVDMAQYRQLNVSSTRIRAALEEGRLEEANAMLGSAYAIDWPVVHGQGLGRKLGTPTINQAFPADALMPCSGVYITRVLLADGWHPAATGVGRRPTVAAQNAPVTCETFVPEFEGDLYGQCPLLEFHRYLCPVRKFESVQELQALIFDAAAQSSAYFHQNEQA